MTGQSMAGVWSGSHLGAVLPGAVSAVPLATVGYPFDTVKTRLQQHNRLGMVQCVREAAAREGLLSLYRGSSVSLCILCCKMSMELTLFEWLSDRFRTSSVAPFAGGLIGSTVSTSVLCPLMVLKVQMQTHSTHTSPFAAASAVWRASGFRGFYRGLATSLAVQVPFSTLFFGGYGLLRESLPQAPWTPVLAGGAASFASWTVLLPMDTLRTISMGSAHQTQSASGVSALVRSRVRESGVRSLWRGFGPVALRALPSSGSSMLIYEWAKSMAIRS